MAEKIITTSDRFNLFVEALKEKTRDYVAEHGEIHPCLYVFVPDGELLVIDVAWTPNMARKWHSTLLGVLHKSNALAYIYITAAWISEFHASDPIALETYYAVLADEIRVRDLPPDDRMDVVVFQAIFNGRPRQVWYGRKVPVSDDQYVLQDWRPCNRITGSIIGVEKW